MFLLANNELSSLWGSQAQWQEPAWQMIRHGQIQSSRLVAARIVVHRAFLSHCMLGLYVSRSEYGVNLVLAVALLSNWIHASTQ